MSTEPKKELTIAEKEFQVSQKLIQRVSKMQESGTIKIKNGFNAENAIKSALMHLQDVQTKDKQPVLIACSESSINQAIFKMIIDGLSVVKGQCAFIARGNNLVYQKQYAGNIKLAKDAGLYDVKAHVIYEGDDIQFYLDPETGNKKLVKHDINFANMNTDKIKGAYAITKMNDGTGDCEIMNMSMIKTAWEQGQGEQKVHKNFPDQMVKKTVITRACKLIYQSSNDLDLFESESYEDAEYEELENSYQNESKNQKFQPVKDELNDKAQALPEHDKSNELSNTTGDKKEPVKRAKNENSEKQSKQKNFFESQSDESEKIEGDVPF